MKWVLPAVFGREHKAQVAYSAIRIVLIAVQGRSNVGIDFFEILCIGVFGFGIEAEHGVRMPSDSWLNPPQTLYVASTAKKNEFGVDFVIMSWIHRVFHVFAVSEEDAWPPMPCSTTEIEPGGVEVPWAVVDSNARWPVDGRIVMDDCLIASHGAYLIEAVVEKRLERENPSRPPVFEEERVTERGENLPVDGIPIKLIVAEDIGRGGCVYVRLKSEHVGCSAGEEMLIVVPQLQMQFGNCGTALEMSA